MPDFSWGELITAETLIALVTLAALEIVLGIDNIVFIAIITGRLPENRRSRARKVGLLAAMGARILLLFAIAWIMRLTEPFFTLFGGGEHELAISGKDLILLGGGLFLLAKATYEIHHKLESAGGAVAGGAPREVRSVASAIAQIMMIDVVFSLDSVITAVGMTEGIGSMAARLAVMIAAVILAVIVMMIFADPIANFIERHPTMKMLALSFLILIGVLLVAEGFHQHIDRGYVYFAMAFSLAVELLNIRVRKKTEPGAAA